MLQQKELLFLFFFILLFIVIIFVIPFTALGRDGLVLCVAR